MCARERQTDRETDKANQLLNAGVKAEEGVAIETVCLVLMVQNNTAHCFSLGEPEYFGGILGLCLCASALGMHM